MPARSGILCAGAWCVDRNYAVNFWPPEETVSTILRYSDHGGCPGHNMSSALKRLGAPFTIEAMGLIGEDALGAYLLRICNDLGIERHALTQRKGIDTALTLAMTAQDTKIRTFFSHPGAFAVQCPTDFDFTRTNCRIVHLGLAGLMPKIGSAICWLILRLLASWLLTTV